MGQNKAVKQHKAVRKVILDTRTRIVQKTVRKIRKHTAEGKSTDKDEAWLNQLKNIKADYLKKITDIAQQRFLANKKQDTVPPNDDNQEVDEVARFMFAHPYFKKHIQELDAPKKDTTSTETPRVQRAGEMLSNESMFLTSLNSSIAEESDDGDDMDEKIDGYDSEVESMLKQGRKNRPGQRRRQQLAERKFGSSANHLKNSANHLKNKQAQFKRKPNAPVRKPEQCREAETEELHPSWAARRKQSAAQPFSGKVVKFDAE
jgi:hypothetical protein